jgi:pyruvate formate lyase activating enzyme
MASTQGIITHLQRMSLHDGPGIRTTVFFKGCNLRCKWCHNPETFSLWPELGWTSGKCMHCGACIVKCPRRALSVGGGDIVREGSMCVGCNVCVEECYTGAHHLIGKSRSVEQICRAVEEDRSIFEMSGGGVTISGGEPTVQYDFLKELLEALHLKGIHTALQTNMYAPWEMYEGILPCVDYFMCDLKLFDDAEHARWTGKGNRSILRNLQNLDGTGRRYRVRTPLVPGVNDSPEQLEELSAFAGSLKNLEAYELLPFHPLASYKYHAAGIDYAFEKTAPTPGNEFLELKKTFEIYADNR